MPRAKRHYRISLADAIGAHERALTFGGRAGIPNPELVEAAIARPYAGYYRTIASKAAALVHSVACNHGFADGNKRTAVILVDLLLEKSGYRLKRVAPDPSIGAALEKVVLDTVTGAMSHAELEAWFKPRITRVS